jgi:exosortase/archaeosortase family protein
VCGIVLVWIVGFVLIFGVHALVSGLLFRVLRVPSLRQGLTISLPGFDIQIAEQCSGIRSATVLVLASSLAAYVFLRVTRDRLFLVFITIPIVILKNAVRIVTLSGLVLAPLLLQLHKSEAHCRIEPFMAHTKWSST